MSKRRIPSRVFTVLVYLFLYAPIALLIIFSFNSGRSNRVWEGFSLQWYLEFFQDTRLLGALRTTLILSVLAAVIATLLGTAAAIGFYSMRRRSRGVCLAVNNIPLTNADIITGVSMMLLFVFAIGLFNASPISQALGLRWRMGFGTLLIAHITFDAPYVILSVMPKLRQLDPNIYEAAQDLGLRPVRLPAGHPAGDPARRAQRHDHRLYHVHRRFCHQLFYQGFRRDHPGRGDLYHGQKARHA